MKLTMLSAITSVLAVAQFASAQPNTNRKEMTVNSPKAIVLAYHEAFHNKDRATVRKLLADQGQFIGPLSSFSNPDTFLDAAAVFMKITKDTKIKALVVDGNNVAMFYDYTTIVPSIPTLPLAVWFQVENGKVVLFHVHFDPTSVVKASENGDIAKALQSLN